MEKPDLKVLEGGLSTAIKDKTKYFVSSYITDTRLMGVIVIYARWRLDDEYETPDLHQFFYIDCEETGLETYSSLVSNDPDKLAMMEQSLLGGLGAEKTDLNERQLRGLICKYMDFNKEHNLPVPDRQDEFAFLVEPETKLTDDEYSHIMDEICADIVSDYQAINYFLMRCFGSDHEGAAILTSGNVDTTLYDEYVNATFCKNVIDREKTFPDGAISYMCESLVDAGDHYETIITKVAVKDLHIVDVQRCSKFSVSPHEAAMMLSKPEFVTVHDILMSEEDMESHLDALTINLNTVMSTHENGTMLMAFKPNNDHVDERVFRLSNDVKGVYFITLFGQLIAAAYSISDIHFLESKLRRSMLAPFLTVTARYEFHEPILFEFVQSEFTDFDEFLDYIKE